MWLSAAGYDQDHQLGIEPTNKSNDGQGCVDVATRVPFDLHDVKCIVGGGSHSIIIKGIKIFAAGNDIDFRIGSDSRKVYKSFTEVRICDDVIIWAACGESFTLYLTIHGKVILCHSKSQCERITVPLAKKAVAVFAGFANSGIIDEDGAIYILDNEDPHKIPVRYSLGDPAVDLVCCKDILCALSLDGRAFISRYNNNSFDDFEEIMIKDEYDRIQKVTKISGYYNTLAVLTTYNSRCSVYVYSKYECTTLRNGRTAWYHKFNKMDIPENVKDVSCSNHILVLTDSDKVYGCGKNNFCQLFKKTNREEIQSPIHITTTKADQVIACDHYSFIFAGIGQIIQPRCLLRKSSKMHKLPRIFQIFKSEKILEIIMREVEVLV